MGFKWPVAYYDGRVSVPLEDHLVGVAKCAMELFSPETGVLEKRHGVRGLRDVLALSAALHDLGKASRSYHPSGSPQGQTKVSFRYHEFLSALIVYLSATHDDEEQRVPFWWAAKVIARHHAPMWGRHPVDFLLQPKSSGFNASKAIEIIGDKLGGLDKTEVIHVIDAVNAGLSLLTTNWFKSAMDHIEGEVPRVILEVRRRGVDRETIENLATVRTEEGNYYPIIGSLAGMLMVCDNLVAHYERRVSDDGASPGYVMHWENELGRRIKLSPFLKGLKGNVPEPDAPAPP